MSSNLFECQSDKKQKYYKVIQTGTCYSDGKHFPLNGVAQSERKVNLEALKPQDMGGFCISTYPYIFRWLIRGDTLCEVIVPENTKIYKTSSDNGIYVSDKIILKKPKKIDDKLAMELYKCSTLPEKSYFMCIAVCAIKGYMETALKVLEDKVNKENVCTAIMELENFCKRRETEFNISCLQNEEIILIKSKLEEIKNKSI